MPDSDVKEIWDKMTAEERDWYERFIKATRYRNFTELQYLCDLAPSDKFEELKSELVYEAGASRRNTYKVPVKYNSRYTEWDYAWSQPHKIPIKEIIKQDYNGKDKNYA